MSRSVDGLEHVCECMILCAMYLLFCIVAWFDREWQVSRPRLWLKGFIRVAYLSKRLHQLPVRGDRLSYLTDTAPLIAGGSCTALDSYPHIDCSTCIARRCRRYSIHDPNTGPASSRGLAGTSPPAEYYELPDPALYTLFGACLSPLRVSTFKP